MSGNEGPSSALAILRSGIEALACADLPRLEQLAVQAAKAGIQQEERSAVREHYAALGLLLGLTRRNLRLLGGERGGMYTRG